MGLYISELPETVVQDEDGYLEFKWPQYRNSRSQDLEPYYHDAGQFYCLRVSSFLAQQNLIMEKTVPMELPDIKYGRKGSS